MSNHVHPRDRAKEMGIDIFCRYYDMVNGKTFICPDCGSEDFCCMDEDDFILDADRMEYIINDDEELVGGRLTFQFCDTRVTIDTQRQTIVSECEDERYETDTYYNCESLNDALRRRWNKVHRDQYIREGYRWGPRISVR